MNKLLSYISENKALWMIKQIRHAALFKDENLTNEMLEIITTHK